MNLMNFYERIPCFCSPATLLLKETLSLDLARKETYDVSEKLENTKQEAIISCELRVSKILASCNAEQNAMHRRRS